MFTKFFESPLRIQKLRDCPDGRLLEGFAQELHRVGYAQITARRHLRAAEHLVHWTGGKGIRITALDERFAEEFSHHLDRCRCQGYGRTHRLELQNAVRLFIGYLRHAGVLTAPINMESIEDPAPLVLFGSWMRQQRGTCDATLYNYGLDLRDLLKRLGEDPARLDAQSLRKFVLERSQQCGWAAAKRCTTAVRMFLRFLIADGKCAAGLDASIPALARRLGQVIRFARYIRAEDKRHEMPPAVFGSESRPRPVPYIFSGDDIQRLVQAASELGRRNAFRGHTYSTFFALLACTGRRVSEAIRLSFDDITSDGLIIRCSKFRKSRLVPLHETAQAGLYRYLETRRSFAPLDDHLFVSLRRRRLLVGDAESAFHQSSEKIGLPRGPGLPHPTIHFLRHSFAVRALETCPDGRDRITRHMLVLSTYLGHSKVADTYWYLQATPDLMRDIADSCQDLSTRGQP